MSFTNRRRFMVQIAGAGAVLGATRVHAQTMLDEKDPQAVALGYVADTARADNKKFPKHSKDQLCSNCSLFQGKATDAAGGCPLFPGKQVAAKGWCSAWVKKA
jgi:hypothetical protein